MHFLLFGGGPKVPPQPEVAQKHDQETIGSSDWGWGGTSVDAVLFVFVIWKLWLGFLELRVRKVWLFSCSDASKYLFANTINKLYSAI